MRPTPMPEVALKPNIKASLDFWRRWAGDELFLVTAFEPDGKGTATVAIRPGQDAELTQFIGGEPDSGARGLSVGQ